jgi:hypothetical protein
LIQIDESYQIQDPLKSQSNPRKTYHTWLRKNLSLR